MCPVNLGSTAVCFLPFIVMDQQGFNWGHLQQKVDVLFHNVP